MSTAHTKHTAPLAYLVILNWNGFDDTHECLLSLRKIAYYNYRVLVVDNASHDDSPERLIAAHPEIELIRCEQNLGIAGGYNRGIQVALAYGAEYIVVMNNDLVFAPAFLAALIALQRSWIHSGVIMPKIYYYDDPDVIWSAGAYTRWLPSNIVMRGKRRDGPDFQRPRELEFAPSCCLLLTREVCRKVAFDEHYFFYYDDWDFCRQVRDIGQRIVFAPDAHLWHKVSRSTQNSPKSLRWWQILGQSCVRYHRKHHTLRLLAIYVAWVLLRETIKGNARSLPTFLRGIRIGLRARTIQDLRPEWST